MKRVAMVLLIALAGCSRPQTESSAAAPIDSGVITFLFVHGLEKGAPTYRASTADASIIAKARADLRKPLEQRALKINGKISAGEGPNPPWKWFFTPSGWTLGELNIELCDGQPSYVDEHLDEWLKTVGSYCPWSSRLVAEL